MADLQFHKIVAELPQTYQPDSFYLVRVGVGFDLYLSDLTGAVAHQINKQFPEPAAPAEGTWLPAWSNGVATHLAFPAITAGTALSANASGELIAAPLPEFVVFTDKAAYDAYTPQVGEIVLYQGP